MHIMTGTVMGNKWYVMNRPIYNDAVVAMAMMMAIMMGVQ
jgi:hypothetical protein